MSNKSIEPPLAYGIVMSAQFKKELKIATKRHKDIEKLKKIITLIATAQQLPAKYKNHRLSGNFSDCFECHIEPDWLLIYRIDHNILILYLLRTGTHADLFT